MLYKYNGNNNIEMMPVIDFKDLGKYEKDLEDLLAQNLSDLYSEDEQLMTIFQERKGQEEPDLCALDKHGNLIIFELKRGIVQGDTTIQVMRYSQTWGQKNYFELNDAFQKYTDSSDELRLVHAEAFGLDFPLHIESFNSSQKLVVIGSSADVKLMNAVSYWKSKGINIDFTPYRFYRINNETYFEFFAKPYDHHIDIQSSKGIIFDTNKKYNSQSLWDMFSDSKVSAYGEVKTCVKSFKKDDYVLYYHVGVGIVGVGKIKTGKIKSIKSNDEMYLDVEMLTPIVKKECDLKYISKNELEELLDKTFFWARTDKRPFLSKNESEIIAKTLSNKYSSDNTDNHLGLK
ncbi:hypothetical protein [Ruminococcus flavefaciens]|uniref:hypothetical protein n=1 Tax=Ruminococcus flavefaciens TaxID=1265 RepID=UPI0002E44CFE|nr:hypothetical protein [Ruminococcus flavefaciens]